MMTNWLPGWTAIELYPSTLLMASCRGKCEALMDVGCKLFGRGVLPEFKEVANIPPSHRDGTGGNFAIRHGSGFVVTGAGTHKGKLGISDFALVERVLWETRKIWFYRLGNKPPSTDSLLVSMVFEMDPAVSAWIHVHCAVKTPYALKLHYPAIQRDDWDSFREMLESGAQVINLIDHDVAAHHEPNSADSVIILGENIAEAAKLAFDLIH